MHDYIENHLTMDDGFYMFADIFMKKYHYALLSNDVSDWSRYITEHYGLDKYLPTKIVSADVHCRKPEHRIFELALEKLSVPATDCIFIDNSVENLRTAFTPFFQNRGMANSHAPCMLLEEVRQEFNAIFRQRTVPFTTRGWLYCNQVLLMVLLG